MRFPPELVLRSLVRSIVNELERAPDGLAFIAVPDDAHNLLDTNCLPVSELARGLGVCGAVWRQEDTAVDLICCRRPHQLGPLQDCGWRDAVESYAL